LVPQRPAKPRRPVWALTHSTPRSRFPLECPLPGKAFLPLIRRRCQDLAVGADGQLYLALRVSGWSPSRPARLATGARRHVDDQVDGPSTSIGVAGYKRMWRYRSPLAAFAGCPARPAPFRRIALAISVTPQEILTLSDFFQLPACARVHRDYRQHEFKRLVWCFKRLFPETPASLFPRHDLFSAKRFVFERPTGAERRAKHEAKSQQKNPDWTLF